MDRLYVNNIRAYGYTGALSEEQVLGQWFSVDLVLSLDLSPAGKTDRLGDTYNYVQAVETVQQIIQTRKFALIEKLAETIAQSLLEAAGIHQVQVRLTKCTPPIPNFDGTITVEITRPCNHG
ncbi:dihydroneopterin aldolase [Leptolyngbya ohadii]|uniref:dihydroneopterin aldolase n=1 Tax=Leptolyngbya ohadii TaxID=1962290 RepID=UPI000B59ABFD|nr:dihydroneopterin aldolase [Leptolyngbya ohadii]